MTNLLLGDGGGTYRCGEVDRMPTPSELCSESGQEAHPGGTGCWTEWGETINMDPC